MFQLFANPKILNCPEPTVPSLLTDLFNTIESEIYPPGNRDPAPRLLYGRIMPNGFLDSLQPSSAKTRYSYGEPKAFHKSRIPHDSFVFQWASTNESLIHYLSELINAYIGMSNLNEVFRTKAPTLWSVAVDFYFNREHEAIGFHQDGTTTGDVVFVLLMYAMPGPIKGPEWVHSGTPISNISERFYHRKVSRYDGIRDCPEAIKHEIYSAFEQTYPANFIIRQPLLTTDYPAILFCDPLIFHSTPGLPSRQLPPWAWALGLACAKDMQRFEEADRVCAMLVMEVLTQLQATEPLNFLLTYPDQFQDAADVLLRDGTAEALRIKSNITTMANLILKRDYAGAQDYWNAKNTLESIADIVDLGLQFAEDIIKLHGAQFTRKPTVPGGEKISALELAVRRGGTFYGNPGWFPYSDRRDADTRDPVFADHAPSIGLVREASADLRDLRANPNAPDMLLSPDVHEAPPERRFIRLHFRCRHPSPPFVPPPPDHPPPPLPLT